MNKIEALALAISHLNDGFNPGSKAFELKNPGLLKTYRPEKQVDAENYRIFTSVMGGFKALTADIQAKVQGRNQTISPTAELQELLIRRGFKIPAAMRPIVLYLQKALKDESITVHTPLSYFADEVKTEN